MCPFLGVQAFTTQVLFAVPHQGVGEVLQDNCVVFSIVFLLALRLVSGFACKAFGSCLRPRQGILRLLQQKTTLYRVAASYNASLTE